MSKRMSYRGKGAIEGRERAKERASEQMKDGRMRQAAREAGGKGVSE